MTAQRLKTLHRIDRLAQLREQRDRLALAVAIAAETEARRRLDLEAHRLDGLLRWRTGLLAGGTLDLDRYAWAVTSAVHALEDQHAAEQTLRELHGTTLEHTQALESSHRRHETTTQRCDRVQHDAIRCASDQQREHALDTWLTHRGDPA